MAARGIIALLLFSLPASAREIPVSGTVTYVSSGVVYTSLGRNQGIEETTRLWIERGSDTLAILKVIALSSKSSACTVLTSRGQVSIGAPVNALVRPPTSPPAPEASIAAGQQQPPGQDTLLSSHIPAVQPAAFDIRGRVSAQLRTVEYEGTAAGLRQPGIVLSLQARSRSLPVTADVYSNLRTASYGGQGLFAKGAVNQSRFYRLSVTYDDGRNAASIGRTISTEAWTLGSIDGAILSRRWGRWKLGGAAGFQPEGANKGISTSWRKLGLFASYDFGGADRGVATAVYMRSYKLSILDRETVSGVASVGLTPELALYGSSEIDLRRKRGDEFVLKPSLSMLFVNLNYRVSRLIRIGVGGDASRPVYAFSDVRMLADSLIERRLIWGVSLMISVSPLPGLSLSNTLTSRTRGSALMKEYVDYAALTIANLAATGVTLRSDLNVSRSDYTNTLGIGGGLQRQIFETVDIALRYHRSRYTIIRGGARSFSTTMGADLVVPVSPAIVLFGSYEWFDGYGTRSRSLMAELSVRF
jgi:hypothetical protein